MLKLWVVRGGKLVSLTRHGECLGCGECCTKFNYKCARTGAREKWSEDEEKADWSEWEGWAVENWDGKWIWWGPFEIIPLDKPKCKTFESPNRCLKFEQDNWPEICRKFPLRPEDLAGLDNCGFYFEEGDAKI